MKPRKRSEMNIKHNNRKKRYKTNNDEASYFGNASLSYYKLFC